MRRFWVSVAAMVIIILTIVGCGSPDDSVVEGTTATETSTTQSPATETSTTETPAAATLTTRTQPGDDWTTVATLHSTDSPWKGMEGILISEPFAAAGEVQLALDMPDAGELDGVIAAIVSADKATDPTALIAAIKDGVVVTLLAAAPTKTVPELDGTYVLVNSVPQPKAWSLEVRTRP